MPQQIQTQEPPVLPSIILRYYRYPLPTIMAAGNNRFAALVCRTPTIIPISTVIPTAAIIPPPTTALPAAPYRHSRVSGNPAVACRSCGVIRQYRPGFPLTRE